MASASHLTYTPIPLPPSANPAYFGELGRQVEGYDPEHVTESQTEEIIEMLYKVRTPSSTCLIAAKLICSALYPALPEFEAHAEAAIRVDPCE